MVFCYHAAAVYNLYSWLITLCISAECALEDETYEDGAETQVECNRCVCACGNWVCTAMTCGDKQAAVGESADTGAEMTEEEWNLRVAELNKHQETVEKMKTSTKEV
ncbi:Follistatin- protein 1 [Ameca splendens]|uniref:Follistatin- protein 1 n=1 Tax=Ameca splendens TaxID=208324 RepID=A0ABV0ZZQ4_9TELE